MPKNWAIHVSNANYAIRVQRPWVYHHNLDLLLSELELVCGSDVFSPETKEEVIALNTFYKTQRLRYGDKHDFTADSFKLSGDSLHKDLVNMLCAYNEGFSAYALDASPSVVPIT